MSFYSDAAGVASSLLAEFGQKMKLAVVDSTTYDPASGKVTAGTSKSYTTDGVMFDFDRKFVDQTMILQGDKQVYLSTKGLPISPRAGMILTDAGGTTYTVISVKPLAPALVAVLYELHVRN